MTGEIRNIRLKLLFAFLLPAVGLLYFSAGQVRDKFTLYQNSRYLEQVVSYVGYAAELAKELQKERGLSLGLLTGNKPAFFRQALDRQRRETDHAFQKLYDFLWKQEHWQDERAIKAFLSAYAHLAEYRKEVDSRSASAMELFDRYSTLIQKLFRTTDTLSLRILNNHFIRTIKSFEEMLALIEISGKERALIAALLQNGMKRSFIENRLETLEKEQERLYENFIQHATVHAFQIYRSHVPVTLEKRYNRVRREIVRDHRYDLIDTQAWWNLATQYINALYRVDFALLKHLNRLKEAQKSDAVRTLAISISIWGAFVVFLYLLLLYIFRMLDTFAAAIERSKEESRLYRTFAEFSEYQVVHRNRSILLDALLTLLYQSGKFRYLWLGRIEKNGQIIPIRAENLSPGSVEETLEKRHRHDTRLHHALRQLLEEKHPLHFAVHTGESPLYHEVGEIALFPILQQKNVAYVLGVALPRTEELETYILDLIQKMCHSLGNTLEMLEVERKEKELEEQLRIAATAFNAHEAITITNAEGVILQVNDAFTRITGYTADEVIGKTPSVLKSGKHDKEFYVEMWDSIRKNGFWKGEIYNRRKNGEIYPEMLSISAVKNEEGKISHYVAHFFDISEIKSAQKDAEYRAQHDALTHLFNRQKLTEELERIYRQAHRTRDYNAFLYLDVDNFKYINDYYNHEMGDKVLIEVAHRLQNVVHGEDLLARIAGDEFALILCCLGHDRRSAIKKITIVVEKIKNLFHEPIEIDGVSFEISFSIGIKLFPDDEREWSEVMINADVAMYHAKKSGKNRYNFFDEHLDLESKRFLRLKNEFAQALRHHELVMHYQPRVDTTEGRIVGMEALVRWQHPERGLLGPDEFLFVAQGNTLGYELNEYVLNTVCRQIETWQRSYPGYHLKVSVNISGEQFNSRNYIEKTMKQLREYRHVTPLLEFEIVEDALLEDLDHTVSVIREFKQLGIGFCMDDFGTGYSSIEYLKRLPIDIVKIDRGFILDLFRDRNDEVVKLIVKTAEIFGMKTVAEGVENAETLAFLRRIGCTYYQGYYFAPPVPASEIEKRFLSSPVQKACNS